MEYFTGWKTVGHIPSQILRYVYFFIKQERDRVYGKLKSLKYKTSRGEQTCLRSMVLLSCQSKENSNSIETYCSSVFEYYGRPKKHNKRRHRTHTEIQTGQVKQRRRKYLVMALKLNSCNSLRQLFSARPATRLA